MSEKNTGGPAFPCDEQIRDFMIYQPEPGMSLRDYLAAKALVGLLHIPDEWRAYVRRDGAGTTWRAEAAKTAYALADEMLRARET